MFNNSNTVHSLSEHETPNANAISYNWIFHTLQHLAENKDKTQFIQQSWEKSINISHVYGILTLPFQLYSTIIISACHPYCINNIRTSEWKLCPTTSGWPCWLAEHSVIIHAVLNIPHFQLFNCEILQSNEQKSLVLVPVINFGW